MEKGGKKERGEKKEREGEEVYQELQIKKIA